MKLKCIYIFFFILGMATSHAQNLVPNHDFSQINSDAYLDRRANSNSWAIPPGTFNPVNYYKDGFVHWFTPPQYGYPTWQNTPTGQNRVQKSYQVHHRNTPFTPVDTLLPYMKIGGVCNVWNTYPLPAPQEGDGYACLVLMDTITVDNWIHYTNFPYSVPCPPFGPMVPISSSGTINFVTQERNFIETKLLGQLDADSNYTIEFYTNRRAWAHYTTSDISAYCSVDTFKYEDYQLQTIVPQATATDSVYSDWNNYNTWTHVKGSFIAQGGEQFLTLGNFVNYPTYPQTWCSPHDTNGRSSYGSGLFGDYYFDAVYLYKSSDTVFFVNLPNDTTLCNGDSLALHAHHTETFKLQATKTFLWSNGSTDSTIYINSPGTYWVEVAYNNRWKQYDTIVVNYHQSYPGHSLSQDTTLCSGQSLTLSVPAQDSATHLWSTGNSSPSETFSTVGQYWVQTTTPCDTIVDTIHIAIEPPYDANLPNDTVICINQNLVLFATQHPNVTYTWSNGSTTNEAVYFEPGTATLHVQTPCGPLVFQTIITQTRCEDEPRIFIPNAFSPNGNGTNDFFEIFGVPEPVTLHIFNRWGQKVFYNADYKNNWDGTFNGQPLTADVYTYLIEYNYKNPNATQANPEGSTRQIRGTVTLIR